MSLTTKVALGVATVVVVVVALVGTMVFRATESELRGEIDEDLLARAERVTDRPDDGFTNRGRGRAPTRGDGFVQVVGFDALARVVGPDGEVALTLDADFDPPADPEVFEAARSEPVLGDGEGPDGAVRVVTTALPDGGFLQIARPLDEVESVLTDLRRRTLVIGVLAAGAAALVAWAAARRTLRPVGELTDAAARVASTGDLTQPIEATGDDEVGRLAASFRTMLGALAASKSQQRRLVMDASHELRTPLTSLRTNVGVLSDPRLADDDRAAVVEDLDAELVELTALVEELVDLAADVRSDEAPEPVRLEDLAAEVVARAERRSGRTVRLETVRSAVVEARPEAMTRAIRNLVDNAVKFSPAGTMVRVVVDGGSVTVIDAGPGIPAADRADVFERFHRLDSTRDRPGSGLGLAIVAQVASAHGGTTAVGDAPGGGATVSLTIPTVDD